MATTRSAGAVIYRDGRRGRRFLLLHYPSGHWDFVKGKIEAGETEHQAAEREAAEETGIRDLEFRGGFEKKIGYQFMHMGETIDKTVVFFLAETRTSDIVISHEHRGHVWLDYDAAVSRATFENARSLLADAKDYLSRASD